MNKAYQYKIPEVHHSQNPHRRGPPKIIDLPAKQLYAYKIAMHHFKGQGHKYPCTELFLPQVSNHFKQDPILFPLLGIDMNYTPKTFVHTPSMPNSTMAMDAIIEEFLMEKGQSKYGMRTRRNEIVSKAASSYDKPYQKTKEAIEEKAFINRAVLGGNRDLPRISLESLRRCMQGNI